MGSEMTMNGLLNMIYVFDSVQCMLI